MASPAREVLAIDIEAGKDDSSSLQARLDAQKTSDKLEVCYFEPILKPSFCGR